MVLTDTYGRSTPATPGRTFGYIIQEASLEAQMVKNPPAMWETQVQSLGWEDSLEKEMATQS